MSSLELKSMESTLISPTLFSDGLNTSVEICLHFPPNVNSGGLWIQHDDARWWLKSTLPLLELQLALYFLILAILRFLLKPFRIPKLSIQILTGLLFGYSWNEQWDEEKHKLFSIQSEEILGMLAYFGYMLFLFISAVKMDVRMIATTRRKALIIGIPTLFVPLILGMIVGKQVVQDDGLTDIQKGEVPLMAATYSMISFPVVASLLSELKIVSSELGRLGLSTALICDLLSQFLITMGNQIRVHTNKQTMGYVSSAVVLLQYYLLLCFAFRPAVLWIIKHTPEGKPVSRSRIQGAVFFVILSTALSTLVPQPAVIGPYVLGLAIPADGGAFSVSLVEKLDSFASDFFLPIFVFASGLHVDLSSISVAVGASFTRLNILLALSTFAAQVMSCFVSSLYCKLPLKQSLALSLMLACKGATELFFFTLLMEFKHITDGVLAWLIVFLLVITTFVPMAVKWLYDPSRKFSSCDSRNRNIMHLYTNSELRILACLHQKENIFGLLHLLNLSCPTSQNPIAVYVIHLIELVGRTTPIFISHRIKDHKAFKDESFSENILLSFDSFEKQNNGTVYVECFTAISPHKFMHNDICKLALDKITSLIILPFHRTWTAGGLVDQDDNAIRAVNCSVVEKAPCSVGIFADKGHLGTKMAADTATCKHGTDVTCRYSVCVIFLGGSDDREAISFAKRLAKDSRIELMVLKIIGSLVEDGSSNNNWDKMLDSEALSDFKTNSFGDGRVRYMEEVCEEGPQTALKLREIVKMFDIMIVGRRNGLESPQTSGLTEWNEFTELGVLGDLIVSLDINNKASVLVIQQKR